METLVVQPVPTAASGARPPMPERILRLADQAYRVAVRVMGSTEGAEDVVQEAYLAAVRQSSAGRALLDDRAWFLQAVANLARKHIRGEVHRRRREAAMGASSASPSGSRADPADAGLVAALLREVGALDEQYRVPVALCYEENLSQREAAAILEVDESTVCRRLQAGIERLRSALERGGYAVAPAAVIGALAHTAPPVPGTLAAALQRAAAESLSPNLTQELVPGSIKGGTLMKIGLGMTLAGLVAGGAIWAAAGRSGETAGASAAPAASGTTPKKFDIPVWHPDARWKMDGQDYAGDVNLIAPQLDGPRHEVMWGGHRKNMELRAGMNGGGSYVFMTYDEKGERFHPVTTGAAGCFDGPFPVARFFVDDYHGGHERADSPDGRFHYMLDSCSKMRALDFAEQRVSTLPGNGSAVACGESGKVYLVEGRQAASVTVLSPGPEWKVLENKPLQGQRKMNGLGSATIVDEKQGRLYATTYGTSDWYVWYWDLKDGSLHGVLPNCTGKPGAREKGQVGPFEGTVVYNHGEICWGPDDPDKRFIYMTRVDTSVLFRLDLEKKMLGVFNVKEGRFVEAGSGEGKSSYSTAPTWCEDGSFQAGIPWYMEAPHLRFFRRVK